MADLFLPSFEFCNFSLSRVISLFSMSAQDSLLVRAATEMSIEMQKKWFDALMYQDMSYHDSHDSVGLSSLISTNASQYKRYITKT